MIITIDTAQPLSKTDVLLLAHLVAEHTDNGPRANGWVPDPNTPGAVVKTAETARPDTDLAGAREAEAGEPTTEETTGPIGPGIQENAGEPAAEPVAEEKPKRKRRTKAEMEAARRLDAEAEQAEQAEQADEPEEEAPADEGASPTVIEKFRAEAVELATNMVAQGQRPKVIEALKAIGAPKVSAIPDDKLAAFLAELKS